jgi:integral membrane protein
MTPKVLFRTAAIAEAITWTLLIAALILRATTGFALGVTIAGGIHGFVFLAYGATAVLLAVNQRWHPGVAATAIVSAIIPYATIPVELWLARTGRLEGDWRREETDDPRDRSWIDRLARWFIRHPVLLLLVIAAAVVVLFVVLLTLGPPQLPGSAD